MAGERNYYEEMNGYKERINSKLLPVGANVGYVGTCLGSIIAIWHFGKSETGFAGGGTPEAVTDDVFRQVFGGL